MAHINMKKFFSILVSLGLASSAPSPIGLFSVVQFPNDACTTSGGLTGTCVTSTECTSRSGSAQGTCAAGFGVCCEVSSSECTSSATTISQNNTYIRNPSYPSTYPTSTSTTSCSFTVSKISDGICQLRLDFQDLELGQTASTGACTDTFQATVSVENDVTTSYPSICGYSTGSHMYLDLGRATTGKATLKVSLAASSSSAKWNILTRQIECDTQWTAPSGCAMWFTGISNEWSMYGTKSGTTDTEYLQSQNYKVCIRQESGYCSIRHDAISSTSFELSTGADAVAPVGKQGSADCYMDFIVIPQGSQSGNAPTFDRYCGKYLEHSATTTSPQSIISKSLPFEVYVHTNAIETPSATPNGVSMKYQQLPC